MNAISQFPAVASGPSLDNRRIAAAAVDLAAVAVAGLLLSALAGGEFTLLLAVLTVGWALFYYFACESAGGQTLGKRLLGLRVQRVGGGAPDERAIALRTVLRVVDGIGFYLVGLVVMLRTGQRRQRLGDIVAGTVVADARGGSLQPSAAKADDGAAAAPEAREVYVPSLGAEAEPHRAELPSQLFELGRDEYVAPEPVEAEEPRVEIVSSDEDPASEPEPEPEPEPELPRAEDVYPEPVEDELPRAEADEPTVAEPELPRAEADEPEPEPEPEEPTAAEPEPEDPETEVAEDPEAEPPLAAEADSKAPRMSSPALEELADDVAATASKPSRQERKQEAPADAELPAEKAPAEEAVTVKPVETVAPMDLVMDQAEDEPEPAGKGSRSRPRARGGSR